MKNTFKFVVFCVLNSYINSNINAVEPNANLTVIEKKKNMLRKWINNINNYILV